MLVKLLKRAFHSTQSAQSSLAAGLAAYREARYGDALTHFEKAIALDPDRAKYRYQAAAAEYMLGHPDKAWSRCEEVLERRPNDALASVLMSRIALPGPYYTDVLSAIHNTLKPRTYVEIGVNRGKSIRLAHSETRAVGIDPFPKVDFDLPPTTAVYAMTSDDYFAQRDVRADLGGEPIELAFIDGLHHFEAALRDFINVEKHAMPQSTVLVHDWYPLNRRSAEREWTDEDMFVAGDVWRLALVLKKYRPDLEVATIATAPTGLGVVKRLDPSSKVLRENYDAIVEEFTALDYGVLDDDKPGMLNLIQNDWTTIFELLTQSSSRPDTTRSAVSVEKPRA